jgi:hypothetical protein
VLHSLSLGTATEIEASSSTSSRYSVNTASLCQFKLDPKINSGLTSAPRGGGRGRSSVAASEAQRVHVMPLTDSIVKSIERQLPSATPKCAWPNINRCKCINLPLYPASSHGHSSSVASSDGSAVEGVEVALIFDSPFARRKLRAVLRQAEQLLCTCNGAFLHR